MDHGVRNEQGRGAADTRNGRGKQGRGPDLWNYVLIVLVVLVIFTGLNRYVFSRGTGAQTSANDRLSQLALEYYMENYGDQPGADNVQAVVRNLGCHQEIHLYRDNELIMRMTYFNGRIYEIS